MADNLDIQFSGKVLQGALALMEEHQIPTTPSNIRVWYEYSEGENKDLTVAVSELLANGISIDAELSRNLYSRFFGELPHEKLAEFRAGLRKITAELGIQLNILAPDSSECENALAEAEQKIADGCELEALRAITTKLIAESRKVVEQNQGMGKIVTSMQSEMSNLEVNLERASTEALTDKLTEISNRRAYDKKLDEIFSKKHNRNHTCILMLDIDHFKRFNDDHGHIMGDKVLRFVAQMVKKVIKGEDFLARTGGEEFQLILEDCTLEDATKIAEKIRKTIESSKLTKGKERTSVGNVTISIGVAAMTQDEERIDMVNRVDRYLYDAKEQGRNRVVSEPVSEGSVAS